MKKLFSLLVAVLLGQNMYSQEVIYVDENGFPIKHVVNEKVSQPTVFKEALQLQRAQNQIVVNTIDSTVIKSSSDIEVGKNYHLFEVIEAEDSGLIGKSVVCQVIERHKSNLTGLEGRLVLRPLYIENGSQQIPLVQTDIFRRGKNNSNVKEWLIYIFPPLWFIAGSGAKIEPNERFIMTLEK